MVHKIRKAILKEWPHAWVQKIHGSIYQENGIPDLLVCVEGLLIGLEVKHRKPGESHNHAIERTTSEQRIQIGRIKRAGGAAATVLGPQAALDLIATAIEKHRQDYREEKGAADE